MSLRRSIISALLVVAFCPSVALACTPVPGTDLDAFYRMMALPGRVASGVSVLAAIVWLVVSRSPTSRSGVILIALAALNPGWWLWDIGDCGMLATWIGGMLALLSIAMLATGLWHRHARRKTTAGPLGV